MNAVQREELMVTTNCIGTPANNRRTIKDFQCFMPGDICPASVKPTATGLLKARLEPAIFHNVAYDSPSASVMIVLYIFTAFGTFIAIATFVYQLKLRRHAGISRESFVEEFRKNNIPDRIPAAVYDYYQRSAVWRQFRVSPDDSYEEVFLEGEEDIDDDAKYLLKRLGMELPVQSTLDEWNKPRLNLRDMVLWLDWVRRQHE